MTPEQAINSSPLGLGTSVLASWLGGLSTPKADHLLSTAYELGVRLIDTSNTYASGECERLLGRILKNRRENFSVMTKAGYTHADLPGPFHLLNPLGKKFIQKFGTRQRFEPEYLQHSIRRSLQRLNTDYVDVFVLHDPPADCLRDGYIFEMLDSFRKSGYARTTGVSSGDNDSLVLALQWPGCGLIQTPLQLDGNLAPALQDPSISNIPIVLNHVSLGGRLPGRLGATKDNLSDFREIITHRATELGVGLHAALLVVALETTGATSVLTGTRNIDHLIDNAKAIAGIVR